MILDNMKNQIKGKGIRIVLTEGHDARVLGAAIDLKKDDMIHPVLTGSKADIEALAAQKGWDISDLEIIDIETYPKFDELVEKFVELRKGKATAEQAAKMLKSSNYFGTMLVKLNEADGLIGGATYSTADTVRPALQLVKTKPGAKTVSSSFVIFNDTKKFIMGDCAIIVEPTSGDLVEIAKESAVTARTFGIDPKVAFLTYSTKGSGKGASVDKVVEAVNLMKNENVDFEYDGEFQFDAAIDPTVGKLKAPESKVAGEANVFVFPTLEAGNIGYKIAQRLGGYNALGPILQGLNAPINDLSRGASQNDVYELSIVTAAQHLNK
ncbi:phosphate acetyltransferase [Mycoplasma sp. P36-A1]|uniref:phosphate acetyltransferase n=1 Tax=Mycoplasma sp. P36-A1 TaxID=3252900 RepID=UPI003C2B1183